MGARSSNGGSYANPHLGARKHAGLAAMEPLVSVEWLAQHLQDQDLRVFDATIQVNKLLFVPLVRSGRRDWRRGHIPGSAFADLFALSDAEAPRITFTLPSAER